MSGTDAFQAAYRDLLDGAYDCVDRIILNGYFCLACDPGGFRTWWRQMFGSDKDLDNAHLIRLPGHFGRRVRAVAQRLQVPVLYADRGDRMHEQVEAYRPHDPQQQGVFCITIHRAPNSVWSVEEYGQGGKNLIRKEAWVNHYAFHIWDREWGHITIKLCPHAPFSVQVALNGHDFVACQAAHEGAPPTQQQNCFTEASQLANLQRIAETLRSSDAVGRLRQVCERWLYTACLCYLFPVTEQQRTGMTYQWSNYQLEYSRNLLFRSGHVMEEVFRSVVERTWKALDARTVKTLFGRKHRPYKHQGRAPRFEVEIERPTYDLIVFKVHCGLLTLKVYTKGERVLRIEAIVHNAKKEFAGGYGLDKFPRIVEALRQMVDRFADALRSVEAPWVADETLDRLPERSQVGTAPVAGVDLNRTRMRAVLQAVVALSSDPRGFRAEQVALLVRQMLSGQYTTRQASYDVKKLRGKGLVEKIASSRRYRCPAEGLRVLVALTVLREQVLKPLLAGCATRRHAPLRENPDPLDQHYRAIRDKVLQLFRSLDMAA
jgi:hypothetical protein